MKRGSHGLPPATQSVWSNDNNLQLIIGFQWSSRTMGHEGLSNESIQAARVTGNWQNIIVNRWVPTGKSYTGADHDIIHGIHVFRWTDVPREDTRVRPRVIFPIQSHCLWGSSPLIACRQFICTPINYYLRLRTPRHASRPRSWTGHARTGLVVTIIIPLF